MNTEEVKQYISKGLYEYNWSDEFILQRLSDFGYDSQASQQLLAEARQKEYISDNNNESSPHGWLVVFMIIMSLGALITFFYNCFAKDLHTTYFGNVWLKATDVSFGILILLFAIYIIYAIIKRKPNAIFFAKGYVIAIFVTNLISLIFGAANDSDYMHSPSRTIGSLIWGVIWFLFLIFSEQVKERFPKHFRKVKLMDWAVLLSIIYIPLTCILIGIFGSSGAKMALRQVADEINANIGYDSPFDFVSYEEKDNEFTYFYIVHDLSVADNVRSLSEKDLKILNSNDFNVDNQFVRDFLKTLKRADAKISYTYIDEQYNTLNSVSFSIEEIEYGISPEKKREWAADRISHQILMENLQCPMQLDEYTTYNSCTYDKKNNLITYNYTVSLRKKDLNLDAFREIANESRNIIFEAVINDFSVKLVQPTIELRYFDKDSNLITNAVITQNDYPTDNY